MPVRAEAGPAAPEDDPAARRPRWVAPLLLLGLFALGFRSYWRPQAAVDLFEDGHLLAPAQSYLAGAVPYVGTYPIHGLGADGGMDALFFRVFGPTLEVYRVHHAAATALTLTALGLACGILFRRLLWSAVAFVLCLAACPFVSDRQAPGLLALAALTWAAGSGRRRAWFLAGAVSAAALFHALDFGAMLLVAGGVTAVSLGASERSARTAARSALWLAAGAAAGALPFLAFLAVYGAADDFARVSLIENPARISDIWGLPAAPAAALFESGSPRRIVQVLVLGRSVPWIFHAALLALAVTVLLFRASRRELSLVDRGAVAATGVAIVAMRGVLGRADAGHLALYGTFAALPAAWLLYRAFRAPHAAWLFAPILALVLIVRWQPQKLPAITWNLLRAASAEDCRQAVPRSGAASVPCSQGTDLQALRERIDRELAPQETFFDFGNEPALYFLLDRRPPVRYCCVPFYEGEAYQREVIADLERERPPIALIASGTFLDDLDGISNRKRTPLVAEYLDRHYEPAGKVGARTLARRRSAPP